MQNDHEWIVNDTYIHDTYTHIHVHTCITWYHPGLPLKNTGPPLVSKHFTWYHPGLQVTAKAVKISSNSICFGNSSQTLVDASLDMWQYTRKIGPHAAWIEQSLLGSTVAEFCRAKFAKYLACTRDTIFPKHFPPVFEVLRAVPSTGTYSSEFSPVSCSHFSQKDKRMKKQYSTAHTYALHSPELFNSFYILLHTGWPRLLKAFLRPTFWCFSTHSFIVSVSFRLPAASVVAAWVYETMWSSIIGLLDMRDTVSSMAYRTWVWWIESQDVWWWCMMI